MTDEVRESYTQKFNTNVEWLREQIAPEDIYVLAEQALMAADFFILELSAWVDLQEEAKRDKVLGLWLKNVLGMRVLRDRGFKGKIDLTIHKLDEL